MRLESKTVVVTGAGSGIGRATAKRCAEEGATVVVTDVDVENGKDTVAKIRETEGKAEFRELDVVDYDAVAATLKYAHEEYNGLDLLHNNAGTLGPVAKLTETTLKQRDRVIDVNIKGVWNGCHAAVPLMKENGGGSIVNGSSVSGYLASPEATTYCLTKAAVLNFTRAVAHEVGSHGIRVNAVCPGMTKTQMLDAVYDGLGDDPEAVREEFREEFSLGRLGEPEDIANCVIFLLSDEAAWVTGHGLPVDGGFSIH